jgi:hypothetical protein
VARKCIGDADRGSVITVWAGWANEWLTLEVADGVTTARGVLHDQAQLYGVLERVADMGLELVGVEEDVSTADSSITAKKGQSNVHHPHT